MKVGVFDPVFEATPLEAMLDRVVALGLEAVELGTGNYPGNARCNPAALLADAADRERFARSISDRGLTVSALSCHGNPIHPDPERASHDDGVYRDTVRLAAELGIGRVNVFAGCPGDGPRGVRPSWVATTWPPEFVETLAWQWDEVVVPYWTDAGAFAREHGIRIGVEMEPGFVVYNPATLQRLRRAVGDVIGVNLDPSHLFWQGIDVIAAVETFAAAIVHVDAKDTVVNPANVRANGLLDLPPRDDHAARPWTFRTVGDGHDVGFWTEFVRALRRVGYDDVISIEHEDPFVTPDDGLPRAAAMLRNAIAVADTAAIAAP